MSVYLKQTSTLHTNDNKGICILNTSIYFTLTVWNIRKIRQFAAVYLQLIREYLFMFITEKNLQCYKLYQK